MDENIPPEKLAAEAGNRIGSFVSWLNIEKGELFHALLWSAATVIFCIFIYLGGKWFFKRLRRTIRQQFLQTLLLPLCVTAALTGIFSAFEPLGRRIPQNLAGLSLKIYYTLLVIVLTWAVCRVIAVLDRNLRLFAERNDNNLDKLTIGMLGSTLKIAAALTAFLFIGQNIFNFNITALLASAGVIGLSLALAAKDTVSNFFGTLVIVADSPFRIGDRIECDKVNGIVINVGMRSSRILLDDESVVTMPNSILTNSGVRKINARGVVKKEFTLDLLYDTPPEKIEAVLLMLHEILDDFGGPDAPGCQPHIYFAAFGEYSLKIRVMVWFKCRTFREAEVLSGEVNLQILRRFAAAGVQFAYPTQTLLVEKSS